ncbi:winged helix-turn-helix transcriptional regulator [Dickeya dadantii]|uniref:winged helix-turn-helix transcriptional regulator n=1 Tax=Dickeya dadantii TaxID=204038 RepID=UPI0020C9967E|nr:helix-turn-helix domain-containing protein [Dickeya dadantii]
MLARLAQTLEPVRFNALKRGIKGSTQKMLTQTLRKLERDGLISRKVFNTVPVTVEYALTPLGDTLTETVATLAHWAEKNIDAVLTAQAAWDAASKRHPTRKSDVMLIAVVRRWYPDTA